MKAFFILLCSFIVLSFGVRSDTGGIIAPSAEYSPRQVIEIQLMGLAAGDDVASADPHQGIKQVWAFAHPDNKRATGPLMRFAQLFMLPAYAPMLGHSGHEIEQIRQTDTDASFIVSVTAQDGRVYAYMWTLRLTDETDVSETVRSGWWMTSAVSSPRIGDTS